jgi:proline iminopeptidase
MTRIRRTARIPLVLVVVACSGSSTSATPSAADSGFVAAPGARLFYKSVGNREPILVVHGGPGMDHTYLLPGMLGLAKSHRMVFYDQRGGGRTDGDVNASTVSFDRFLADVDAVIDSLKLGRPVLLGHSWGGFVAMRYAARYPDRLRALILMNTEEPGQRYEAESFRLMRQRLTRDDSIEVARIAKTPEMARSDTSAINGTLRIYFRATFADRSLAEQLSVDLDARTAKNMAPVATLVMGPLMESDFWSEVATIRVPTLIVQGAQDVIPLAMPRELAKTIPFAQLAIIENAGHFPYIEKPTETFGAINSFLARVKPLPRITPDGRVPITIRPKP